MPAEIFTVVAVLDLAGQDHLGERVLQRLLDHALQRARAISRIVALVGEPFARRGIERRASILRSSSSFVQPPHLDIDDAAHLARLQAMEQDDLVDAVEEFRTEAPTHHAHHLIAHRVGVLAFRLVDQEFRAEIRRHHDQRVAEIDRAALPVGQAAVVEHLQQHVEHVRMRLLDLVEQDRPDKAGAAPLR